MKNLPQKVRSKKLSSRVDLTAMVSVSFLLIIFFMVVGELSKPKIIDLSLPDNGDIVCRPIACVDTNRIYTILLDDKDRIVTYSGLLQDSSVNPKEIFMVEMEFEKNYSVKKEQFSNTPHQWVNQKMVQL